MNRLFDPDWKFGIRMLTFGFLLGTAMMADPYWWATPVALLGIAGSIFDYAMAPKPKKKAQDKDVP